ncbi:MAG TPA: methyltransferase domain-containing protein [Candidatus Sulfotelmatobacter sp.]|jgi:ubiquinone/menaquinone biosynthesis C-methylase UbiE
MKIGYNVGSGQRPFKSTSEIQWINTDKIAHEGMPAPDLLADGAHLPCGDQTADYFVLSQVYEHFGCGEAIDLLQESYRVLKPGGSLIISVPNMKAIAQRWVDGLIDEYIFMVCTYGAFMGHEEDRHRWGTTPESLVRDIEKSANWKSIQTFNSRPIPGLDVARDWWITCLEAIR